MNVPLACKLVLVSREPASSSMTRGIEHQGVGYNCGRLDSVEKQRQICSKAREQATQVLNSVCCSLLENRRNTPHDPSYEQVAEKRFHT